MTQHYKIFIDGQAGTTGLQISERLSARDDLLLLHLDNAQRKDPAARQQSLCAADVAILCLPDDAAREAVALLAESSASTRLLDASTAFRTDPAWAYGLPELQPTQRALISNSRFVSNPGCYPQGFILMVRPLIEQGLLNAEVGLRCHAMSGYSGGGRQMIAVHENDVLDKTSPLHAQAYALHLDHKHVPEMHHYAGTKVRPIFVPTVAHYYQGMVVHLPLFREELNGSAEDVLNCLAARYADEQFIQVSPMLGQLEDGDNYLNSVACNGTNNLQIMVLGNDEQLLLTARYDNLGKGAAGAAVQNLNLMLGLPEALGL